MSKKQHLFLLIKSLTKAEKRYFKLFVAQQKGEQHKHNNYLRLFEAIDKQETYDEQLIKKQFVGQAFVKQLHVTKNYLNQLILKSLRNFHSKISKDAELKDLLRDVEILFHKELYDQCNKLLDKASQIANTYEKLTTIIEINNWKRRVCLATATSIHANTDLNVLLRDNELQLKRLNHLSHYWDYTINLMAYLNESGQSKSFLDDDWFCTDEKADTIQAQKLYHHILMGYYVMVEQNYDKALEIINHLTEILEAEPAHIVEDVSAYITLLNNKVGLLLDIKQYEDIPELLQKIRQAPTTYKIKELTATNLKAQLHTYNVELELHRDTQSHVAGIQLIPEIESFLKIHLSRVPEDYLICFYYQFAYLYFKNKQYSEALKWLNQILNNRFNTFRDDLESYARFLYLVIHFELGNIMVLKYAIESCRRFLKKKKQELFNFEKVLLRFFSKLCTQPSSQYKELFIKLMDELFVDSSPEERNKHLDFLDFATWIQENLKKKY